MFGLKEGNKVLREIQKEMSLESVERLMEETKDAQRWQREVGEMLAERVTREEEEEVEDELEALRREVEDVRKVPEMPSVPGGKLVEERGKNVEEEHGEGSEAIPA